MIKFFRRIRQQLVSQNKFSKYMLYAIGEIILVVIGILIALSINNWNEARKDRGFETQALINLKAEFDEHQEYLEYIISIKERQEDQGRALIQILSNDTIPISDKVKARTPNNFDPHWSATYSVLNSLLSTGDITKIKNDSLKYLLTNWFVRMDSYKNQEKKHTEALDQKAKYLNNKRFVSTIKKGDHSENFPGNYYPNNLDKKNDALRASYINELEYYNLTSQVVGNLYIQIMGANQISKNYREVSRLIVLELKNRGIELDDEDQ